MQDVDPLMPISALPARLGIKSTRTVYRWIGKGLLPKPVNINGRNYLRTSKVEEAERRLDGDRQTATANCPSGIRGAA